MALYTLKSGVNNHPEDSVLQLQSDIVIKSGVLNPESDLLVGETGGGGLHVDIAQGRAYIKGASTNAYPVRNTAAITVDITSNSSGNPRIDAVVVYIDVGSTPGATNQGNDVAKTMVIAGTPAVSPAAPLDADIQTAVGAGNPFLRLANVTVASGATGVSAANIANVAPRVFMKSRYPYLPITYAASITPDYSASPTIYCTLTGNVILNEPTNMAIGDILFIDFIQDGTGGRTLTFNFTSIKESGGEVALGGIASETDTIAIKKIGADAYYAYMVGGGIA